MVMLRQFLVCCVLLLSWAVGQAAPAAGAIISNTAYATFVDSATSLSVRLTSSTVNTQVSALEALTLTANQSATLTTGAIFTIGHTLTNTGNADSMVRVSAAPAAGSGFAATNLQVVQDVNKNGIVDAGEPVVPAAGISLAAGAHLNLLVSGQAPSSAAPGQRGLVVVTATTVAQRATASTPTPCSISFRAPRPRSCSPSTATPTPGSLVTWTAMATNSGNLPAGALAVLVDGTASSAFVLRAAVPLNAALDQAMPSTNVTARMLYHLVGSASGNHLSTWCSAGVAHRRRPGHERAAGGRQPAGPVHGRSNGIMAVENPHRHQAYVDWTTRATRWLGDQQHGVGSTCPPGRADRLFIRR